MIKVKAKYDEENNIFSVKYDTKKTWLTKFKKQVMLIK